MEKYYRFAGVQIAVHIPEQWMYTEDRTLEPFRVENAEDPYHFYFEIVDALTPPKGQRIAVMENFVVFAQKDVGMRYIGTADGNWEAAHTRVSNAGKNYYVQLKASVYGDKTSANTVLNTMQVERKGKAILFTAPSGTGKSTQADLWQKLRGTEIINGDRAVVRVTEDGVFAAGIPFAGSSQICKNRTLPVEAIVYLGQAPQTTIRPMRGVEAFRRVWEGVSVNVWDKADVTKVMDTVQQVTQSVPVFYLPCTPDESAVVALEKMLRK